MIDLYWLTLRFDVNLPRDVEGDKITKFSGTVDVWYKKHSDHLIATSDQAACHNNHTHSYIPLKLTFTLDCLSTIRILIVWQFLNHHDAHIHPFPKYLSLFKWKDMSTGLSPWNVRQMVTQSWLVEKRSKWWQKWLQKYYDDL